MSPLLAASDVATIGAAVGGALFGALVGGWFQAFREQRADWRRWKQQVAADFSAEVAGALNAVRFWIEHRGVNDAFDNARNLVNARNLEFARVQLVFDPASAAGRAAKRSFAALQSSVRYAEPDWERTRERATNAYRRGMKRRDEFVAAARRELRPGRFWI